MAEEYNSHNTERLNVDGMCEMMMELEMVRKALHRKAIHHEGHEGQRVLAAKRHTIPGHCSSGILFWKSCLRPGMFSTLM